jgi:hypothetical protein
VHLKAAYKINHFALAENLSECFLGHKKRLLFFRSGMNQISVLHNKLAYSCFACKVAKEIHPQE